MRSEDNLKPIPKKLTSGEILPDNWRLGDKPFDPLLDCPVDMVLKGRKKSPARNKQSNTFLSGVKAGPSILMEEVESVNEESSSERLSTGRGVHNTSGILGRKDVNNRRLTVCGQDFNLDEILLK